MATLHTFQSDGDPLDESEAEQVWLAQKDFAEAQRLAAELVERLGSLFEHAHNANMLTERIELPDSLSIAESLSKLAGHYIAEPYAELCECRAPLGTETCAICGQRFCTGDALYGVAPTSYTGECGRTAVMRHVKGTYNDGLSVCSRHKPEEIAARGLDDEWPIDSE